MTVHYMYDNHTFLRLDGLPVEIAMEAVRKASTDFDAGYGFVGCKPPHGNKVVQWRPGDDWEPRVRKLLEESRGGGVMHPDYTYDMEDAAKCGECYRIGALCEVHLREECARLQKANRDLHQSINALNEEISRLREENERLKQDRIKRQAASDQFRRERDEARTLLDQIHDMAHDASTGPEAPDVYWEIRELAGDRQEVK